MVMEVDSSGNLLLRNEYNVMAFTEDWSVNDWNNGKFDFTNFTVTPADRPAFTNWLNNEPGSVSPYNNGHNDVNPNYSITVFKENWNQNEFNSGKLDFSTFTFTPGDRVPFLNWYNNQPGSVSPYIAQTIQCLSHDSDNSLTVSSGNIVFNSIPYENNGRIGVNIGTYTITAVNNNHPIGFIINDVSKFEIISGTSVGNKVVDGITVNFYSFPLTFEVKGDFGEISYQCYNHGYMGSKTLASH